MTRSGHEVTGTAAERPAAPAPHRPAASPPLAPAADSAAARAVSRAAVLLIGALLLLVVVRLPWVGDLGIHAATVERLRTDLLSPGNPMVDATGDSPYYSPWMLLLGILAKATGLGTFTVLRIAALVSLALLLTGIPHFVRTFTRRRSAPALAVLCVLLLWGPVVFEWSGFPGLNSLALTLAYPSTFALGLSFHFWALLTKAVRSSASWPASIGLGLMWAVIMLSHQFTGVVATFGALGVLLGARPWPGRAVWLRLGAGMTAGLVLLVGWPYYSFFGLFGVGGLEEIHRPLYTGLLPHFGFALIGVAALVLRLRRDRRDPLVVFFALGALMVTAGWLTGHYSWGRALPAVLLPAQLAAALAMVTGGTRLVRNAFAAVVAAALVAGAWTQAGVLGYVVRQDALPPAVREKTRQPWAGYAWITRYVPYGDTVMVKGRAARQIPAYGPYTVAPGYPDFFLPDQEQRLATVAEYFAPGSSRAQRLDALQRYGARWVLQWRSDGGLQASDPALEKVAVGPNGQVLYRVVDAA
uniref:hypothetical protein n=1 Tax=Streptomyces polyasparticus TaxID=2767826 RepID=UPI001F1DA996|nr:hypothetical protein [Streptomyces polyasparticus]